MNNKFDKTQIREDLPGIVLLSHGALALGMLDTVSLVMGPLQNAAAFTLEAEDDPAAFQAAFTEAVSAFPAGTVVFVDMFGGSPCNRLLAGAEQITGPYCAFSGMSLPLLLEAAAMRELCKGEELREAIKAAIPNAAMDLREVIASLKE